MVIVVILAYQDFQVILASPVTQVSVVIVDFLVIPVSVVIVVTQV